MFNTPILFLVFNRPNTTKQVFAKIRAIQPKQLFIAADGSRKNKAGEKEKTETVRKLILEGIDWDCEVKTLFREQNLGCGRAVSEGITWFFEHVNQGIILEDDTLPDLSFFPFCEELLEKYKNEENISMISGYCKFGKYKSPYSYSFTEGMSDIWGWATWRRAWNHFDFEMNGYPEFREKLKHEGKENSFLFKILEEVFYGKVNSWANRWAYALSKNESFAVRTNLNMIRNIGFGAEGTHTTSWEEEVYEPKQYMIKFPVKHPDKIDHEHLYIQKWKCTMNKQTNANYSKLKMLKLRLIRYFNLM